MVGTAQPETQRDPLGELIVERQEMLERKRERFDSHWQEVGELLIPHLANFHDRLYEHGAKRTQKLYEGSAPAALEKYASALVGSAVPRNERWQKIKAGHDDLSEDGETNEYLDEVTDTLFENRYDPKARFESSIRQSFLSEGAFGNGVVFVDTRIARSPDGFANPGISYRAIPLSQSYWSENAQGHIEIFHRKMKLTARQAASMFGQDKLPPAVKSALEAKGGQRENDEFWFIHAVFPNPDFQQGAFGFLGMSFASVWVARDDRIVMSRGGYRTMRYAVVRGTMGPGEMYGRGPAMMILPEIKTLNQMRKVMLTQQHLSVAPPLMTRSRQATPIRLTPAAQNPGTMNEDGKPMVAPMQLGQNYDPAEIEMARIRQLINETFLITLFQVLVERPRQTATETLERAKEQAMLLGPQIDQLHSDFIGTITEAELDILEETGALPDMPDELQSVGGEVQFEYESPVTRAQKIASESGFQEWLNVNAPLFEARPHLLDVVNLESATRRDALNRGVRREHLRTDDELEELRAQEQQAVEEAQQVEQAGAAAQTVKTLAEAEAIAP